MTLATELKNAQVYGDALKSALNVLPGFISGAEQLLPQKGVGQQKLEMVKNWIEGALSWEGHAVEVIEALWPKIEPVIATLVSLAKIGAAV